MSVGFDVSANTQSAQAALKQLQDAFKGLQREGQQFADIDLSGATDEMKRDLEIIRRNWADILRSQKEFKKRLQDTGQQGHAPWEIDFNRSHAGQSNAQIEGLQRRILAALLHGLSGQNPHLPSALGGGTPADRQSQLDELRQQRKAAQEQRNHDREQRQQDIKDRRAKQDHERAAAHEEREANRRRQQISGGISSVMGGIKFGAGMAGLQTGMDAIQSAYRGAHDIGKYTDEFMRRTQDAGRDFNFLKEQLSGVGRHLGVVSDESAKLTLAFTRTAHATTIEEARAGTGAAIGLAAGFGTDKEQTVQQMARMSLIGAPGNGALSTTHKKFALLIGQTVGQHNVPLEKGLADFSRLAESSAARTTQAPPSESIAGYLKSLYDVAGKRPGLKGESGISLLSAADEGFKSADNPAINIMMFRALSGRMGTQNWLQIQEQKEKGAFAPIGNTGETNFGAFFKEIKKQFAGLDKNYAAYALNSALGLGGIGRAKALIEIEENRKDQGGIDGYQKDLTKHGIDLEKLDESGIKDLGDIFKNADPAAQFNAAKTKWNGGNLDAAKPLTDEEKARISGLQNTAIASGKKEDQDAFVSALAKTIADHGMKSTPFSKMETELGQIQSTLIDKVGGPIVDGLSSIAAILQKGFGVTPEEAEAQKKYAESRLNAKKTAEQANDEILKAENRVKTASPDEKPEAIKNQQAVHEKWKSQLESANNEKLKNYREQRGSTQKFIDQAIGPWIPGSKSFLDFNGYNPIGMGDSPIEEQIGSQESPQEKLESLRIKKIRLLQDAVGPRTDEKQSAEMRQEAEKIQKEIDGLSLPIRRASGGVIPGGVGGGDRVHAALTPGEYVVNAGAAQKSLPLLNQINSGSTAGDEETPATVRDLQKRLEQLFDPVTRYLAELASGARAIGAGRAGGGGTGGGGSGTSGPAGAAEETHPLIRAAMTGKQDGPRAEVSHGGKSASAGKFSGDGLGFLSKGFVSGRGSKRGAGGPPVPDHGSPVPSARTARHGGGSADSAGTGDAHEATPAGDTPTAQAIHGGSIDSGAGNTGGAKPLLDAISKAEGTTDANAQKRGYASGYDVTLGYGKFGGKPGEGKPLSQMTVGEVKQLQKSMLNHPDNNLNSSAVGKYQVVGKTLRGLQPKMGFKDSDVFSPELQDKIGEQLLKGRGLDDYRKGKIDSKRFQGNIANEWASIPHPGTGRATQHTGTSESAIQSAIAASKNESPPTPPAALGLEPLSAKVAKSSTGGSSAGSGGGGGSVPKSTDEPYNVKVAKKAMAAKAADPDDHRAYSDAVTKVGMEQQGKATPTAETKPPADEPYNVKVAKKAMAAKAADPDDHRAYSDAVTKVGMEQQEFTQKPKTPIPDVKTDQASNGQGVGQLNITLTQADASGAKVGQDVNHRMNLRTSNPHGAVSVATVNKAR